LSPLLSKKLKGAFKICIRPQTGLRPEAEVSFKELFFFSLKPSAYSLICLWPYLAILYLIATVFFFLLTATSSAEERPSLELSREQQKIGGIKTYTVKPIVMKKTIRTVGTVEYDERLLYTINTKFEGWIERLHVNYTGQYVKKGMPVAEIYSPELLSTQEEFLSSLEYLKKAKDTGSKIAIRDAERIVKSAKERLLLWDIPESEIERIEKTGTPLRRLSILSRADGYVTKKYVVEGSRIMPGEKIIDIADLRQVWVIAEIYEPDIVYIKDLKKAEIRLSSSARKYLADLDYIYPEVNPSTRTLKARFVVPNKEGILKPGMFTEVYINISLGKRLAIPEDAVIDTGLRSVVYVQTDEETFEPREVLPGLSSDGMREVLKGLRQGEKVVSQGTFLIDSEAKLKGIKPLPLK
jgi:Cu(I)/Ag(I) efflux system membrane fusion protein